MRSFVRSCVRSGWLWNGTDSLSRERKQNKNIETRRPSRDSRTVDLRFRGTGKMQSRVLARIVFERFRLPSSKVGRNIPRKLFPFVIQDVEGGKSRRSRSKFFFIGKMKQRREKGRNRETRPPWPDRERINPIGHVSRSLARGSALFPKVLVPYTHTSSRNVRW